MTTISKDDKLVTFINVFTVEPSNQQQLVELLTHVTDRSCGTRRVSFPPPFTATSTAPR